MLWTERMLRFGYMYLFLWYDINFLKDNVLKFKLR